MKKFSKLFALGLALALTFGMTVSAAEGAVSPGDDAAKDEAIVKAEESAKEEAGKVTNVTEGVNIDSVDGAKYLETQTAAADHKDSILAEAAKRIPVDKRVKPGAVPTVKYTIDVKMPSATAEQLAKGVSVTMKFDGLKTDGSVFYIVLHQNTENGEWTILSSTQNGNEITAVFHSFSPTAIVEVPIEINPVSEEVQDNDTTAPADPAKSPKTGEAIPAAGFIALICLAGAAVCVRKVCYNR